MPLTAISGGLPLIGGILGNIFGNGDRQHAIDSYIQAQKTMQNAAPPPDLAQALALQQYQRQGNYNPQLESNIQGQLTGINENQSPIQAQMQALQQLQQLGTSGMNAQDRVALVSAMNQANQANQANTNAIIQNMAARGQAGGGAELAARLQASQGSANNMSQAANQAAANAAQRSLQAIAQGGGLAGQIRGQNFNTEAQNAAAANQLNRFNVQNQLGIQNQNTNSQNQAQQYNLNANQALSNANVQQTNAELQRQRQAQQQNYLNQMGYAGTQANALQGLGNIYANQGQATSNMWQGLGTGAGGAVAGVGQYMNNQGGNFTPDLGQQAASQAIQPYETTQAVPGSITSNYTNQYNQG